MKNKVVKSKNIFQILDFFDKSHHDWKVILKNKDYMES